MYIQLKTENTITVILRIINNQVITLETDLTFLKKWNKIATKYVIENKGNKENAGKLKSS